MVDDGTSPAPKTQESGRDLEFPPGLWLDSSEWVAPGDGEAGEAACLPRSSLVSSPLSQLALSVNAAQALRTRDPEATCAQLVEPTALAPTRPRRRIARISTREAGSNCTSGRDGHRRVR